MGDMNPFAALEEPDSPTGARGRSVSIEDCLGLTAELQRNTTQEGHHDNAVDVPGEDDGDWCTVSKGERRSPGRSEEVMMSKSPAYTSFAYSADDGDFGDERSQAKSGGGLTQKSREKHTLTYNASLQRSYSMEKRENQRGNSKD